MSHFMYGSRILSVLDSQQFSLGGSLLRIIKKFLDCQVIYKQNFKELERKGPARSALESQYFIRNSVLMKSTPTG